MKVQIFWPLISGYMAACWRALAERGVDLEVVAWKPDAASDHIGFDADTVRGLRIRLLDRQERTDSQLMQQTFDAFKPDAVLVSGWFWKPYRQMADLARKHGVPVVMSMDTALRFTPRQILGRWVHAHYFRGMAAVLVAGERSAALARWLGFDESRIHIGAYGFDYRLFAESAQLRKQKQAQWPRNFIYIGRYVERKGLDTLVEAYRYYRDAVADPWQLICCGQGPLQALLQHEPGIHELGFMQPEALPAQLANAGAFILPSRFEAWGVALAEAAAAGLPLIASRAVGAGPEILRDRHNGRLFDTGNAASLAEAMGWIHAHEASLAGMGVHSQQLAEPFRAELWAERLEALLATHTGNSRLG